MALIDHVNWKELDRLVLEQQRNRSAHAPVISLFRWWARRPHCFASALLDAATLEFGSASFLVADPFSGGGTVAFEAVRRGLPIYAQDLYPWPSHGLATALTFAPAHEFENAATMLLERLKPYREIYWSKGEDGESWETTHVIRVRVSTCISCAERLFLFREPLISLASRKADETSSFFGCRGCGAVSRRKTTAQSFVCDACEMRSMVRVRVTPQQKPQIKCAHCSKSIDLSELLKQTPAWHPVLVREHLVNSNETTSRLRQTKLGDTTGDVRSASTRAPRASIPEGLETGHLKRHGFQFWEDLYTQRQLASVFGALEQLRSIDASEPVKQHLRLAVLGATEMAGYVCRWERYNPKALEAIANHRFSRSTVTVETNLLSPSGRGTLPRRFEAAAKALRWMEKGYPVRTVHTVSGSRRRSVKGALVVTGSSERQLIQDGAARLVFTDPPYHDDLQYGELSRLFHAWMAELSGGDGPSEASEAVPNAARGTDTKHYEDMVAACLTESNRTLAVDGRLVLTFHNKDLHAWEALAGALLRARFNVVALATVSAENPADHSKRGKESFLADLVIECRPRGATMRRLRTPKVLGVTKSPERRNLAAIGLALAEHVNSGITGDLQPLFHTHLKALKTSRVLIRRGSRS